MRHHFIQTSFAAIAILATAITLYFSVGQGMAAQIIPSQNHNFYTGSTPRLPEIKERAYDSILNVPITEQKALPSIRTPYYITSVIDGNTVVADGHIRIRLAGIKAPEIDEELGVEATDFLKTLVLGHEVLFEPDASNPKDTFGRLRGLLFIDGRCVNTTILSAGLAQIYPMTPSSIDTDQWLDFVAEAREKQVGLWGDVRAKTSTEEAQNSLDIDTSAPQNRKWILPVVPQE